MILPRTGPGYGRAQLPPKVRRAAESLSAAESFAAADSLAAANSLDAAEAVAAAEPLAARLLPSQLEMAVRGKKGLFT